MNKKFILMAIFVLTISVFAGCTPAAEKPLDDPDIADPYDYDNDNDFYDDDYYGNDYDNNYDNDYFGPNNRRNDLLDDNVNNNVNPSVNESNIERMVNQINGVDNCVVVVDGNTAYCGVDTNGMSNSQINNLRKKVTDKIKDTNANINTVYVTTDQLSINNMTKLKREADMTKTRTNKMIEGIKGYFR